MATKYIEIAERYLYATELLGQSYKNKGHDLLSEDFCTPVFHLLSHSCECLLKHMDLVHNQVNNAKKTHDLIELKNSVEGIISSRLSELIFWLANPHFISKDRAGNNFHPNRYEDYKFSNKKESELRENLLEKQRINGFDPNKPLYYRQVSEEQRNILNPELKNYSDYLFSSVLGRPDFDSAISIMKDEIGKLKFQNENKKHASN